MKLNPRQLRLLMRRYYGSLEDDVLAARLDMSLEALVFIARGMALGKNKRIFKGREMPRWSQDELAQLRASYADLPTVEIARALGKSTSSVNTKAIRLGLRKSKRRLKERSQANVAMREDRQT